MIIIVFEWQNININLKRVAELPFSVIDFS